MRFTRVVMTNFLSYRHQEIDLGSLTYVAIAGANGAGKSSIALALAWALFGTDRVATDRDSVMRDGESEVKVLVEFEAEGSMWRVERSKVRGKSVKVRLFTSEDGVQWEPYGDHMNQTAKERIEQLVAMSEDAFFSLHIIDGQSGARFVRANSAQRREILLDLLPEMDRWKQFEETARAALASETTMVQDTRSRIDADRERIADVTAQLDEARAALDELDYDTLESSLKGVDKSIASAQASIDKVAKAEREALEAAQAEREARVRELDSEVSRLDALAEKADSVFSAYDAAERDVRDAEDDIARIDESLAKANESVERARAVEDEALRAAAGLDEDRERATSLRDAVAVASAAIAETQESINELTALMNSGSGECPTCLSALSVESLRALVSRLEDTVAARRIERDRDDETLAALSASIRDVERALQDARADLAQAERAHEALMRERESAERACARAAERVQALVAKHTFASAEEAGEVVDRYEDDLARAKESRSKYIAVQDERIRELREVYDRAREDVDASTVALLDTLRQQRADLVERMRRADQVRGRIDTLSAEVKERTASMREREDSIAQTLTRIEALEFVVSASRPQGIPSMLLDGILTPIENEATRILNDVPGGEGMALRFEQARALKSRDGAREVLDIMVTLPDGSERRIESLSAGESVRVSLALVFAMIAVLGERRGGDALDTVFLDEPLGPLDHDAVPAFIEVLRAAISSGALSQVLVVTHDERVVEALPQRMEVHRDSTGASVVDVIA